MSTLRELQQWYSSHCNGDWEHQYGIKIETLDNPGWAVTIDLAGTKLEKSPFQSIDNLEPTLDWIRCWVAESKFKGVGGPEKLADILDIFMNWAEQDEDSIIPSNS